MIESCERACAEDVLLKWKGFFDAEGRYRAVLACVWFNGDWSWKSLVARGGQGLGWGADFKLLGLMVMGYGGRGIG